MRPLVRTYVYCAVALLLAGCGKEIGDACQLNTDCDPSGARFCDISASDPNGYCTIMGCDYNTCPSEAECVEFFMGTFANEPCDPATEGLLGSGGTHVCNLDEICDLSGFCAAKASEVRYCMRTCQSNGDCRGQGYECRTFDLMKAHGGQVVLPPGQVDGPSTPGFCVVAPATGSG